MLDAQAPPPDSRVGTLERNVGRPTDDVLVAGVHDMYAERTCLMRSLQIRTNQMTIKQL